MEQRRTTQTLDAHDGVRLTWCSRAMVMVESQEQQQQRWRERKWMAEKNRREMFVRPSCRNLGLG